MSTTSSTARPWTIENLVAKVVALEGEIAALQVRHTELEALAARPVPRSDEQVVGSFSSRRTERRRA